MKYRDPNRKQEAEKYGRPIPSREFILETINKADSPYNFKQLVNLLAMRDEYEVDALKRRLRAMERDGQLMYNKGNYVPISNDDLIEGRIIGHTDGFGFLVPDDDKGEGDLYLSNQQMRRVMHGDRALASVSGVDRKGRREGIIISITESNTEQVAGRYFNENGRGFIVPDNKRINQDIIIPADQSLKAKHGDIVVAAITDQPTARSLPVGKITEVLGKHMAPGMEIDIALRSHNLPHEWSPKTIKEIAHLSKEIDPSDIPNRVDLRKMPLVTIDGADSRDFDDAVYCERDGKDWRLVVAIADVSHYVRKGTALDADAVDRGTSVYFPKQVIPMLPEELSNGLCSLNPKVDRYCMVADIRINPQGELLSYNFYDATMNSSARLTYDEMAQIVVEKDPEVRKQRRGLNKHLDNLYKLYKVLRKQRTQRGAIDFESKETMIIYGEDRKIANIVPSERNDAHKVIEECMITANVCAAKFLNDHKIPGLHRVHPEPESSRIDDLRSFLSGLGLSLSGGATPQPKDYSKVLAQIGQRADMALIQTVLLRSMSQATYSPDAQGHFGLALGDYAHFTSPIRRYPDLLVHRGIRHIVKKQKAKSFAYSYDEMVALGEHCSSTERRAEDASRDVMAWLKCEYMMDRVGETFDGIISAVTGFGLFVELNDIFVEGLVHITNLTSDYYVFDPVRHKLTGEHGGKTYQLGGSIRIKVAKVDLDERKIDFILLDSGKQSKRPSKAKSQKRKKKVDSKKKAAPRKAAKKPSKRR